MSIRVKHRNTPRFHPACALRAACVRCNGAIPSRLFTAGGSRWYCRLYAGRFTVRRGGNSVLPIRHFDDGSVPPRPFVKQKCAQCAHFYNKFIKTPAGGFGRLAVVLLVLPNARKRVFALCAFPPLFASAPPCNARSTPALQCARAQQRAQHIQIGIVKRSHATRPSSFPRRHPALFARPPAQRYHAAACASRCTYPPRHDRSEFEPRARPFISSVCFLRLHFVSADISLPSILFLLFMHFLLGNVIVKAKVSSKELLAVGLKTSRSIHRRR